MCERRTLPARRSHPSTPSESPVPTAQDRRSALRATVEILEGKCPYGGRFLPRSRIRRMRRHLRPTRGWGWVEVRGAVSGSGGAWGCGLRRIGPIVRVGGGRCHRQGGIGAGGQALYRADRVEPRPVRAGRQPRSEMTGHRSSLHPPSRQAAPPASARVGMTGHRRWLHPPGPRAGHPPWPFRTACRPPLVAARAPRTPRAGPPGRRIRRLSPSHGTPLCRDPHISGRQPSWLPLCCAPPF